MRPQALATKQELPLPSGLAASSRIEIKGRILVLDTAGVLFASDNRGQHWRRMKTPWLGRAYELVGFPPMVAPPAGGTEAQSSAAAQSGKTSTAPDYHVAMAACSDGERWMSFDRGELGTGIPEPVSRSTAPQAVTLNDLLFPVRKVNNYRDTEP